MLYIGWIIYMNCSNCVIIYDCKYLSLQNKHKKTNDELKIIRNIIRELDIEGEASLKICVFRSLIYNLMKIDEKGAMDRQVYLNSHRYLNHYGPPVFHISYVYTRNFLTSVRILQQLSQAPANVNFPRIARALSFKPIWNVTAAFIGWKVSAKKACVKIHIVWHAIKIYN